MFVGLHAQIVMHSTSVDSNEYCKGLRGDVLEREHANVHRSYVLLVHVQNPVDLAFVVNPLSCDDHSPSIRALLRRTAPQLRAQSWLLPHIVGILKALQLIFRALIAACCALTGSNLLLHQGPVLPIHLHAVVDEYNAKELFPRCAYGISKTTARDVVPM